MNAPQPRLTGLPVKAPTPCPPTEREYAAAWRDLRDEELGKKKATEKVASNNGIHDRELTVRRVLKAVKQHPGISSYEACDIVGMAQTTCKNVLKELFDAGVLRRERDHHRKPYRYYEVAS